MIVKREGEGWSLVAQVDHAVHAGEISRAWRGGPFGDGAVSDRFVYATTHHELGCRVSD